MERHLVFSWLTRMLELVARLDIDMDGEEPYDEALLNRLLLNANVRGGPRIGYRRMEVVTRTIYKRIAEVMVSVVIPSKLTPQTPWTDLVVRVCLGLYFDLPARGSPSLNVDLLNRAMTNYWVYTVMLLQLPLKPLRDWSDCMVADPTAPLYHLMTLSVDSEIKFPRVSVPFNYDWTKPLSEKVYWYPAYRAAA